MIYIGHTRFSLFEPNSGAWKASNGSRFKSEGEYREYLFSDARLAKRADIFLDLSLPQLALAASGYEVRHLLSYSEHLPEKYAAKLFDAARKYPFLVLDKQERGGKYQSVTSVARDVISEQADPFQPFGVYRLDDDDVLPADFFHQNAPYVRNEYVGMQVSLGTGITAIYVDGTFYNARKCYHPMHSAGLMSVHKFDRDGTMTTFPAVSHNQSDRHYPVIMDSRRIGYLSTRHAEQDTALGLEARDEASILDGIRKHINEHPAAHDLDELADAFPLLDGRITTAADAATKHQELVTSPQTVARSGITLTADPVSGSLKFTTKLVCDMSSEPRNALLSFEFVDAIGHPVSKEDLADHMQEQQVSYSGSAGVGWFRYLGTKPGQNQTQTRFRLPEGVYLGSVKVLKWRRPDTSITVHALTVEGSA